MFKTILPALLLVGAVFVIGSGCSDGFETSYFDNDGDGYGNPNVSERFTINDAPSNYVGNRSDCDDKDADINPGATEIPDNEIDENCNGLFGITFYKDYDNDGFGDPNSGAVYEINFGDPAPDGMVYNNADCNDRSDMINPLADEIVGNGIDDNCNGEIDIDDIKYIDADGDGYGSQVQSPADGVFNSLDCDDTNSAIHPYAIDFKNGIDDDCDGITDEKI